MSVNTSGMESSAGASTGSHNSGIVNNAGGDVPCNGDGTVAIDETHGISTYPKEDSGTPGDSRLTIDGQVHGDSNIDTQNAKYKDGGNGGSVNGGHNSGINSEPDNGHYAHVNGNSAANTEDTGFENGPGNTNGTGADSTSTTILGTGDNDNPNIVSNTINGTGTTNKSGTAGGTSDANYGTSNNTGTDGGKEINEKTEHNVSASDESDSDDDDDDEPPTFKYTRLKGLPPTFFSSHPISAATFHENVFIFGTHTGLIHLAHPDMSPIRTFKGHNASVLSLHTDGTYFASGSMDGTVVIGSVADDKDILRYDFKRPVHAVVLDRQYARTKAFLYGGMSEEVILCTRNWLDQRVDTVLEKNHGPVVALAAVDDLVVWMNDAGITFYHTPTRRVVSVIAKPAEFRSDLYWPRIAFPETDRLLVAWGNYIWSLRVSAKSTLGNEGAGTSIKSRYFAGTLSFRAANDKKVEIEHVFKVDFIVSGIASFHDDQWIVLAYNPEGLPDIRLLSAQDGSTTYEEEIGLSSRESLGLNDYHLGCYIGSTPRYYVLSARAGVVAEQVQLADRLQWYLDRLLFRQAWSMSQHVVGGEKRLGFGVRHLETLVKDEEWEEATAWIKTLLADTSLLPVGDAKSTLATGASSALADEKEMLAKEIATQWAHWSQIFLSAGRVAELTAVIPTDPRWNLPKSVYNNILTYWLGHDRKKAYDLLNQWDLELYDVKDMTAAIEELLESSPDDAVLRRNLCTLYERSYEPAKAVPHLQVLRDPDIVPFLAVNHILPAFVAHIPQYAKLRFSKETDIERLPISTIRKQLADITDILVDSRHEISPATVVRLMCDARLDILGYFYLEELASIDELLVKGFEDELVLLYAQYDRPKLLPFLTSNNNYNISRAIEVCESNAFVDELVYLLAQVGENKKALALILHELDDPRRAVAFAKSQNNQEIWNIVLEHSFSRPNFIKTLIESADEKSSAFYNPITILQNMDADLDIEGLKDSVTVVARDNDMALVVNQLLYNIVSKRSEKVSHMFHLNELRGVQVKASHPALAKFDNFETVALRHLQSGIDVVRVGRESGNTLYSTLEHKLEHVKKLRDVKG